MSKMKNFRLSDEDQVILDALASDWRMSERAVVSELLHRHDPRGGVHVEPDPGEVSPTKFPAVLSDDEVNLPPRAEIEGEWKPEPPKDVPPEGRLVTREVQRVGETKGTGLSEAAKLRSSTGGMKRSTEIPVPDWKKGAPVVRGETRTLTGRAHGSVPKGGKK